MPLATQQSVMIVQPYVPTYRVPLFSRIASNLGAENIGFTVVSGRPTADQSQRRDAVVGLPWQIDVNTRSLKIDGLWLRTHESWQHWKSTSVVVTELAAGCLDTYIALTLRKRTQVGVWGHVATNGRGLQPRLISWQCQRAGHVFAYTSSGRERAITAGAEASSVTTVMNAIETKALLELPRARPYNPSKFVFVGALDRTKRISWLLAMIRRWAAIGSTNHLFVAGEGPLRFMLDEPSLAKHVSLVGSVDAEHKADLLRDAAAILCPGRVGLIAVDSLASGVPIVTAASALHAPEFEYLTPGFDCFVAKPTIDDFVSAVQMMSNNSPLIRELRENCASVEAPTLVAAADNMTRGLLSMMSSKATP